jgi:hypothetical protein
MGQLAAGTGISPTIRDGPDLARDEEVPDVVDGTRARIEEFHE